MLQPRIVGNWIGCLGCCLAMTSPALVAQTTVTTSGGTTNTLPVFTGSSTVGNSVITQTSGGSVGIGTTSPAQTLEVNGSAKSDGLLVANGTGLVASSGIDLKVNGSSGSYANAVLQGNLGSGAAFWITAAYSPSLLSIGGSGGTQPSQGVINITASGAYNGNVGIGTPTPGAKLEVDGGIKLTANSGGTIIFPDGTTQNTAWTGTVCGGDYAESVIVSGDRTKFVPGDVLVIDTGNPGKFLKSIEPYSTLVTGVYSTKPGVIGRRQITRPSADEVPMAMIGIVPTKVSAENGPIQPGDLLVTSSTVGYAMRGTDRGRMLGAVIGKALGTLDSGTGVIEVAVTLQ